VIRPSASPALLLVLAAALGLSACGSESAPPSASAPVASPYLLAQDLPDALSVLEAKKTADGQTVKVVGRVRAYANGVFTLVDDSLEDCARSCATCPTPWDYCCEDQGKVTAGSLVVEARDAAGKDVPKAEMGLQPLDLVALEGTVSRDASGAVVVKARSGWFRRERVEFGPEVRLP
jgi:hypothetical protein